MKQLCLAISLLAYSGFANAFSIQLATNDAKSEADRMFKFNQQTPSVKLEHNKEQDEFQSSKSNLLKVRPTQPKMPMP